jgi:hypothetical protein
MTDASLEAETDAITDAASGALFVAQYRAPGITSPASSGAAAYGLK